MTPMDTEQTEAPLRTWYESHQMAAFDALLGTDIPEEIALSAPVPMRGADGRQILGFLVYNLWMDADIYNYLVFEPQATVEIDANTQERVNWTRLREMPDPATAEPVGVLKKPAAQSLSTREWDSLNTEFQALYQQVADWYWQNSIPTESRQDLVRFDQLFRFIMPDGLYPYYEKLNPGFFQWLSQQAGTPPFAPSDAVPEVNPQVRPPGRAVLDPLDALVLERMLSVPNWTLTEGAVAMALGDFGLDLAPWSPLGDIDRNAQDEANALPQQIRNWPTPEWKMAFETLANPAWEIILAFANEDFSANTSLYVGPDPEEALWVRYTRPHEGEHLISFPHGPAILHGAVLTGLKASDIRIAEHVVHTLSLAEFMFLISLCDWRAKHPQSTTFPDLESLIAQWDDPHPEAEMAWCPIARLASPLPLPLPEQGIAEGLENLKAQGMVETAEGNILKESSKLRVLVRTIGVPRAFAAVQALYFSGEAVISQGFTAIRTDNKLWVWEAEQGTELGNDAHPSGINLYSVTAQQLSTLMTEFVGEPEPQDDMEDSSPDEN